MSKKEASKITELYTLMAPFSTLMLKIDGGLEMEYAAKLVRINPKTGAEYPRPLELRQLDVLAAMSLLAQSKAIMEYLEEQAGRDAKGLSLIWGNFATLEIKSK